MSEQDELLTSAETAALLSLKNNTLEVWRSKGRGPPFLKLSTTPQGPVRYRRSEVLDWLERRSFPSTTSYTAAARSPAKQLVCGSP